jgi:hypothetical protein
LRLLPRERDFTLGAEIPTMVPRMVQRLLAPLLALLLVATLLSGCAQQPAPVPETPAATPVTVVTTAPETTPSTTASPEPYPGALSLGTPYRYGREDISTEVTVYKVKVTDEYDWWSPQWGRYWNTTPEEGNHFLFVLVRFIDRGTARARLPSQSMFVLRGEDGSAYIQTSDRDHSLWIKGIDVKQYDFYYDNTAGWIDPAESNKLEGFFLFEVPSDITPGKAYLEATFSSNASAVWKLG